MTRSHSIKLHFQFVISLQNLHCTSFFFRFSFCFRMKRHPEFEVLRSFSSVLIWNFRFLFGNYTQSHFCCQKFILNFSLSIRFFCTPILHLPKDLSFNFFHISFPNLFIQTIMHTRATINQFEEKTFFSMKKPMWLGYIFGFGDLKRMFFPVILGFDSFALIFWSLLERLWAWNTLKSRQN